ncbi:uncharacterized protein BYT42DRAFT_564942 [Radiomyces spectabilis]|uniref:uncharacterized protein n=1 Tax=Radiomyces spectabilis TaxID=64574 RepID=UPI00221F165F|nr:uncharacterized protein BYT42DRAFT_564942 [Radiomyces spectabilis]KAI8381016.1 hypothetical protein BYT42DRAFT_564942 [Radiomyces spectabilis]
MTDHSSVNSINIQHCTDKTRLCTGYPYCSHCASGFRENKPWRMAFVTNRSNDQGITTGRTIFTSKSTGTSMSTVTTTTFADIPRRLSSGSACETCRKRKTKCDGGQPCAFCASNRIECIHRISKRKQQRSSACDSSRPYLSASPTSVSEHSFAVSPEITSANLCPTRDLFHNQHTGSSGTHSGGSHLGTTVKVNGSELTLHHLSSNASISGAGKSAAQSLLPSLSLPSRMNDTSGASLNTYASSLTENPVNGKDEIPSIMDQLSCRTFSIALAASVDHPSNYPIYPISSSWTVASSPHQSSYEHNDNV